MRQATLGAGLALAPIAWFVSLEANFALAGQACSGHQGSTLLLISVTALVLAAGGSFLAWTQHSVHRRLALFGAASSALFALVIAAQMIPNLILGGCE